MLPTLEATIMGVIVEVIELVSLAMKLISLGACFGLWNVNLVNFNFSHD